MGEFHRLAFNLVLLWAVLCHSPALAQADQPGLARAKDISARYNDCVYFSAVSQFRPPAYDINLAAEYAFDSCKTEGDQLVQFMLQNGLTKEQIEAAFLDKKTGIKKELRKMVNEARRGIR